MERATQPVGDLEPTDIIPGFCVPEMFSHQLLSMDPRAPQHPAPWEGWLTNPDALRSERGACQFACTGEPCDCECGCGWGNLGCGWTCDARGCPPEYLDDGRGAFQP